MSELKPIDVNGAVCVALLRYYRELIDPKDRALVEANFNARTSTVQRAEVDSDRDWRVLRRTIWRFANPKCGNEDLFLPCCNGSVDSMEHYPQGL